MRIHGYQALGKCKSHSRDNMSASEDLHLQLTPTPSHLCTCEMYEKDAQILHEWMLRNLMSGIYEALSDIIIEYDRGKERERKNDTRKANRGNIKPIPRKKVLSVGGRKRSK